jgi:prepilin-type N-terminal cleavage/methylation domain-containing protein
MYRTYTNSRSQDRYSENVIANQHSSTQQNGFSLVELSVVLVILGLLVGGILSGQSLIRASELRAVITEFQRYATATGTFRDKYLGLPGDISDANDIWTTASGGNGNTQVEGTTTASTNETGLYWQHLALAGMIEGAYTPTSWAATNANASPMSKVGNARWHFRWVGIVTENDAVVGTAGAGTNIAFEGNYDHAFFLMTGDSLLRPSGGAIRAEEAWNIDLKLDDGKPATGSVLSLESQGNTNNLVCSNTNASTSANISGAYSVTSTAIACSLVIKAGF